MWKACRQQDKDVRATVLAHKKRAERKKEFLASKFQDPVQTLRVTNCGIEVKRDQKVHSQLESEHNLMVWNRVKIDKYDGRALVESLPNWSVIKRTQTDEELELETQANYERYRTIIEGEKKNIPQIELLQDAQERIKISVEEQKLAPTQKDLDRGERQKQSNSKDKKAGGQYSNIRFDYNSNTALEDNAFQKPNLNDEEEVEEDDGVEYIPEVPIEQESWVNNIAKKYGVNDYCRLVRRENRALRDVQRKIAEGAAREGSKPSRRERRRERDRNRRRAGNRSPTRDRGSPTYDDYNRNQRSLSESTDYSRTDSRSDDSRSSSRSRSPVRKPRKIPVNQGGKFITEFNFNDPPKKGAKYSSESYESSIEEKKVEETIVIKEATEDISSDFTTAVLRKPGDRWNFAKAIDEKFNRPGHNKYKLKDEEEKPKKVEEKKPVSLPPPVLNSIPTEETPQDRLKRKMRQQLKKKINEDKRSQRKKEATEAADRRKREEDAREYNYGLRSRRSPDYGESYSRTRSRSPIRRGKNSRSRSRSSSRSRSPSPIRNRSISPNIKRRSISPRRSYSRSRSPIRKKSRSRSPVRKSSPPMIRKRSRSPPRRRSRSPSDRRRSRSRSPIRKRSRSPVSRRSWSRSPARKRSRSPVRRRSRSPIRKRSRSPVSRKSRSRSPSRKRSRSPRANNNNNRRSTSRSPPPKKKKEKKPKPVGSKYDRLMGQLLELEKKKQTNLEKNSSTHSGPSLNDYNLPTQFH
jgi:arginine/serine-rich splicing factor 16